MDETEPPNTVTFRTLLRRASALFDEVEDQGRSIIVSRYGRSVAMLVPIPPEQRIGRRRKHPPRASVPDERTAAIAAALPPLQREILLEAVAHLPGGYSMRDHAGYVFSDVSVACGYLELAGLLLLNEFTGRYTPTQRGIHVAAASG